MSDAEHFFSAAEKETIAATIKKVEATTSGEIAVMVVNGSDTYPEGIILGGMVLGGVTALGATDYFFNDSLWMYVPCAVIMALIFGAILKRVSFLHGFFTPAGQINLRVEKRAIQAFYEKGLHKTRDASGVLFFLSLFERKVWVVADQGIYQKITQDELQTYTRHIVEGIKSGKKTEALCHEISRFGQLLALHFPIRPDDTNELPNDVIVET
ncbi:MAG: TPM domain-containing protein [Desulfobulbaceae bacterium]|nr:TPM domain-containing protein [Desulfobulbaceae bacterium]